MFFIHSDHVGGLSSCPVSRIACYMLRATRTCAPTHCPAWSLSQRLTTISFRVIPGPIRSTLYRHCMHTKMDCFLEPSFLPRHVHAGLSTLVATCSLMISLVLVPVRHPQLWIHVCTLLLLLLPPLLPGLVPLAAPLLPPLPFLTLRSPQAVGRPLPPVGRNPPVGRRHYHMKCCTIACFKHCAVLYTSTRQQTRLKSV